MFVLMISGSSLKPGHVGSNLGHMAKSAENLITSGHIFQAIIMTLAQNVCLYDF